jgi:hypothetical protein
MPIVGRFGNTSGRPYVEGRLIIPRLGLRADLSFLLDTGADGVFVMPGDALLMGVDYTKLVLAPHASLGIGGETRDYLEPAVIVFDDSQQLYVYDTVVTIGHLDPTLLAVPSLVGRTILDRWNLTYRPTQGLLVASPDSADVVMPIPPNYQAISPTARHD